MTFSRNRVVTIQPSPPPTAVTALPLQLHGGMAGGVFVRHCWCGAARFYRPIYDRRIVVNTQPREPIKNQLFSPDGNGRMILYIRKAQRERKAEKERVWYVKKYIFSNYWGLKIKKKKKTQLICKNRLICTGLNNRCSKQHEKRKGKKI